jgi:hypothetical protein
MPLGATTQVLEAFAREGSTLFKKLFDDTIVDATTPDLPLRTLAALFAVNKTIHSKFDFSGTLRSMLESTILMYQASERQRLNDKKNYLDISGSANTRLVELEQFKRDWEAAGGEIVDISDVVLYTGTGSYALGPVGMRLMIYKASGLICEVMPTWVQNKALRIPDRYLYAAKKNGVDVDAVLAGC